MAVKAFFALSALVLVQSAFSCYCGTGINLGGNLAGGCGGGVGSTGGNFPTASISPNAPTGIAAISDNEYEGPLCLAGNLPFLGTVALQGILPTEGLGQVSYGCGNGEVGIIRESGSNTGITSANTYQPGPAALRCGCGCGGIL